MLVTGARNGFRVWQKRIVTNDDSELATSSVLSLLWSSFWWRCKAIVQSSGVEGWRSGTAEILEPGASPFLQSVKTCLLVLFGSALYEFLLFGNSRRLFQHVV